jgi:peptidoglycan/xylan/chitin deacetylase (PgdA/CDA1 family)
VVDARAAALQSEMPAWFAGASAFYAVYVSEQMRLAALFPKPTSEILKLTDKELNGTELADRSFLLTFDDGPTGLASGTDSLTAMLRKQAIHAEFFALGGPLSHRIEKTGRADVAALYAGHCLAIHGKEHKPHPALATWKESLTETQALVTDVVRNDQRRIMFRPPYGQRSLEIATFVEATGGAVVLWNIDSQDWNAKISGPQVRDRVLTLMLLWRRGIILFHDTHARANESLPELIQVAKKVGITWSSCTTLGEPPVQGP